MVEAGPGWGRAGGWVWRCGDGAWVWVRRGLAWGLSAFEGVFPGLGSDLGFDLRFGKSLARDAVGPLARAVRTLAVSLRGGVLKDSGYRGRVVPWDKDEAESLILAQNERWRRA